MAESFVGVSIEQKCEWELVDIICKGYYAVFPVGVNILN